MEEKRQEMARGRTEGPRKQQGACKKKEEKKIRESRTEKKVFGKGERSDTAEMGTRRNK